MGNTVVKRGSPEDVTTAGVSNENQQQGNHILVDGNRMLDDDSNEHSFVFPDLLAVSKKSDFI